MSRAPRGLHALARLHGVQTAYHDNEGRRVPATPEALMAALRALGVPLDRARDIEPRLQERRRALWDDALDPVVVVWTPGDRGGAGVAAGTARLRTPAWLRHQPIRVRVALERGGELESSLDPETLEVLRSEDLELNPYIERVLPLPSVPPGYHDLIVEVGDGSRRRRYQAFLIAAPGRAPGWHVLPRTARAGARPGTGGWGLFAPLYALHEKGRPARPSYATLSRFADRAAEAGAMAIGTLPLLAAFLDRPYEPSPYAPVSRLFWNGLYVEPQSESESRGGGAEAPPGPLLDPKALMADRRPALEAEARAFFGDEESDDGSSPPRTLGGPTELEAFRARNPLADDYARFRALTESLGPWPEWPDRLRARDIREGDYDRTTARYHLYLQYRAERQLAEAERRAASRGVSLYLDLPLGVHPDGYDVWRERSLFATSASAGAPPDPLAPMGQDWGFPPMHPERSRRQGHRYFAASIRTHLRFARVLRIDHIMQLHRLFWVPAGDAREGVYVQYPAEELYAILCLEARRADAVIVGEDIGTVPRRVRREMRTRAVPGMYVLQFGLTDTETAEGAALEPGRPTPDSLASVGTHDTPMFAGWWYGDDIRDRRERGELEADDAERQLEGRAEMRRKLVRGVLPESERPDGEALEGPATARAVHRELLRRMGASDAGLVLATLEDLWLERRPQNVPGTTGEQNWRRRAARPIDDLADPAVRELLDVLNDSREGSDDR